jgi:hypothetical protein
MFNEGRAKVHDEEQSGRLSLVTEDVKKRIDQHIRIKGISLLLKFLRFLVC